METEIWKALPGGQGVEVSTLGRVRTLDRVVPNGNGMRLVKGQVLKQRDNGIGYLRVSIRIDGKPTNKLVHRLVAQAFIPNPNNLPQVNHIDCDRTNNNVENLEWCDGSYNQQYRNKFGVSNTEVLSKPVFAINLETLEVLHFRAQRAAGHELGINNSNITAVIKEKRKTAGGFWFTKADDNADDAINRKLHDIGGVGLKIK